MDEINRLAELLTPQNALDRRAQDYGQASILGRFGRLMPSGIDKMPARMGDPMPPNSLWDMLQQAYSGMMTDPPRRVVTVGTRG